MSVQFIVSVVTILVVANIILGATAYFILLERKIASWVQDRIGPNRTGFNFGQSFLPKFHFWGLGQPLADGIKMLLKEDFTPPFVERVLFVLAPVLAAAPALIAWAVIPWGGWWDGTIGPWHLFNLAAHGPALIAGANVNIGIIYILAVGSIAVYGVVVGGYASNNKYAFLGGMRATAQMLSYEIPLGLSVLIVLLMVGSLRPDDIIAAQSGTWWNIIYQPLLAAIFFTCNLAETNRAPFDLAECEQELVAGYHTEYSSMKFALYMLGEYIHIITGAAFFALVFLGGYDLPFVHAPLVGGIGLVLFRCLVYAVKVFLLVALVMLVRWTLPRFRYDQLMRLAWGGLIPVTLVLLVLTGFIEFGVVEGTFTRATGNWLMLAGNGVVILGILIIGPRVPQGAPVNRRVPLTGSRFSPAN